MAEIRAELSRQPVKTRLSLGMEAVWRIDVVDFPAFVVVDDKGNDFFQQVKLEAAQRATPVSVGGAAG
jgi:tartrate dehydratase beta subunit/fumarate hydratase class I family protein